MKEDVKDKKSGWALKLDMKEKKGIKVVMHMRPMEGKSTKLMRSDMVMRNIKMEAFKKFCSDPEAFGSTD